MSNLFSSLAILDHRSPQQTNLPETMPLTTEYETITQGRAKRSTAGNRMRELLEKAHQEDDDELFKEVEDDEEFVAPREFPFFSRSSVFAFFSFADLNILISRAEGHFS